MFRCNSLMFKVEIELTLFALILGVGLPEALTTLKKTWHKTFFFVGVIPKHQNIIISIHCCRDANRLNGRLGSTKLSHWVLIKQYNFSLSLSASEM